MKNEAEKIDKPQGNGVLPCVSGSTLIREHCRFKDAPCNYTGKGWYDRCAWCKDNNGFRNKNEDTTKPF